MNGSSGDADGSYPPGYPSGYPPTTSSSYSPANVIPLGFVDPDQPLQRIPPAQRMPTALYRSPYPSMPAQAFLQSAMAQGSTMAYYTLILSGGPMLQLIPSASTFSVVPVGSLQARAVPYPPAPSCTDGCSRSGPGPVTGMPYPPTTPGRPFPMDPTLYETSDSDDDLLPEFSCYHPGKGTIKSSMDFEVEQDVEALQKAMTGSTTDDATIIDIICARSEHERLEIARVYKESFGRDLVDDAKAALRGNLEDIIVGLLYPLHEYLARELRKAIAGLGTDEECLIEILCTHSNRDIRLIKDHYQMIFNEELEKDVIGDTSGDFRRLLVSMCNAQREENTPLDPAQARNDAAQLQNEGVRHWGTDVSTFNRIIANQSYEQLRLVFREYNALANHTVMEAIKSEMSGDLRNGFLAIVKCVDSPPFYFAEMLYHAMKGLGTNDRVLKRVVLSRCEKDLELIKQEYLDKYEVTLASDIQSGTSGNYREALLAIVQGN